MDGHAADKVVNLVYGSVWGNLVQAGWIDQLHIHQPPLALSRQQPPAGPTDRLKMCVARIFSPTGEVAGLGTVVSRRLVVTTVDVAENALVQEGSERPTVRLDLPFADPAGECVCTIERWRPDALGIVVLRLTQPPTQRLGRVWLTRTADRWGDPITVVGPPCDQQDGVFVRGVIDGLLPNGCLEAEMTKPTGPGFHGAPVYDDKVSGTVGVMVGDSQILPAEPIARAAGVEIGRTGPFVPAAAALGRRAYRLGFRHVRSAQLESLPASEEREHQLRIERSACADDCDFLGVELAYSEPCPHPRLGVVLARIADGHAVRVRLAEVHGPAVEAAFTAGFLLAAAAVMLSPPAIRDQDSHRFVDICLVAGLPIGLAEETAQVLRQPGAAMAEISAVGDCHDRAVQWWDEQLAQDWSTRAVQRNLWGYARNAALAAALHERGADPQWIEMEFLAAARRFGDELDVEVQDLFELGGNEAENGAMALHYLLREMVDPVSARMVARHGAGAADVLMLATRVFAWLIYPADDFRRKLISIVLDKCRALAIPDTVYAPLVTTLESTASQETVKRRIVIFDKAVTAFFDDVA
jgi:hypothetical protein